MTSLMVALQAEGVPAAKDPPMVFYSNPVFSSSPTFSTTHVLSAFEDEVLLAADSDDDDTHVDGMATRDGATTHPQLHVISKDQVSLMRRPSSSRSCLHLSAVQSV